MALEIAYVTTTAGKAELAARLGQLLQANQLPAFIEQRALQVLARDGSLHLDNLSQGRYVLAVTDRGCVTVSSGSRIATRNAVFGSPQAIFA